MADTTGFGGIANGDGFAVVLLNNEVNDVRVIVRTDAGFCILGPLAPETGNIGS